MKVIVDTSVWSLALRRKSPPPLHAGLLADIIADGRAVLPGVIRQEILSGIRHREQWERLQQQLRAFPDLPMQIDDHEMAAEFFNICMRNGLQGSHTDFLICAMAHRRNFKIFTTNPDFDRYKRHLPIELLKPEGKTTDPTP